MPKNQRAYNLKIKTPHFLCRFIKTSMRKKYVPSLLQRNSEALWPPKFLTFYKLFTNEEETPLTFTADSEALWANKHFSFFTLFTGKEKSPSLYMGLQKHFDHPKFASFTNCLHSKPLFKEKWHFSNSHLNFWATKNPIRFLAIPNRIFLYNCFAFRKEYPHLPLLFQPFLQIVARIQLPTFCRANRESFGFHNYASSCSKTARSCIHSLISTPTWRCYAAFFHP